MTQTTQQTITIEVKGDGTALANVGFPTFGLVEVTSDRGRVSGYVPDPDNDNNTIVWVKEIESTDRNLPSGLVNLSFKYAGM